MHEIEFAIAALPEPPVIYRVQLRPYSLGHELHLWRRGNPFITKTYGDFDKLPGNVQHIALLQAVNVCRRTYTENMVEDRRLWRTWTFISRFYDLKASIEKFRRYTEDGSAHFKAELPTGQGYGPSRMFGAPYLLRLYQFVCAHVPENERRQYSGARGQPSAWDYPKALAAMQNQCLAESEGRLNIHNPEDDIVEKRLAELDAAEAATGKLGGEALAAMAEKKAKPDA